MAKPILNLLNYDTYCTKGDYEGVKSKVDDTVGAKFTLKFNTSKGIFGYKTTYELNFRSSKDTCSGALRTKSYDSGSKAYTAFNVTYNQYKYREVFIKKQALLTINGEEQPFVKAIDYSSTYKKRTGWAKPYNTTCYDYRVKDVGNVFRADKSATKTPAGLYYIAYDEEGNPVGYSKSESYTFNAKVEVICKYMGNFKKGSRFVIHCYYTGRNNKYSFPCEFKKNNNSITNVLSAPNSTSTRGVSATYKEIIRYDYSIKDVVDENSPSELFNSTQAEYFGERGKCPYRSFFKGYCKPIPYSFVLPALQKAQALTEELNPSFKGTPSAMFSQNVDTNLPDVASIALQTIFADDAEALRFDRQFDQGKDIFLFAIDKNGIVRMSSGKGLTYYDTMLYTQRTDLHGTLIPYLYGVKTSGIKEGDPLDVYISREGEDFMYRVHSGTGDGTFPFKLGQVNYYDEYLQIGKGDLCPTDISTRIWGWVDEVGVELEEAEAANDLVFSYQKAEEDWNIEKADFEKDISDKDSRINELTSEAEQAEQDYLKREQDAVSKSDLRYDDFFKLLNDGLTRTTSNLSKALGSSDADDDLEDNSSNFSGEDPFRYNNNNF